MRQEPFLIDGITMKAIADVIVNSSHPHGIECLFYHAKRFGVAASFPVSQKKEQVMGCGEFGGRAEPAVLLIKHVFELFVC